VEKNFSYWSEGGSQANLSKTGVPKIEAMIDFWFERVHLMRKSLFYSSMQTTGSYDIPFKCYSFAAKTCKNRIFSSESMLFSSIHVPR
jgi:hypothetical protein